MNNGRVHCPVCGSGELRKCGPPRFRPNPKVAGVPIQVDDLKLRHYRCDACTYRFVWPAIPQERLLACYQAASGKNWSTSGQYIETRSYGAKRKLLEKFSPGRRVLDFGCFDGGFMEYLGEEWERFGIEPSSEAAAIARRRGVNVIAATLDDVPAEYAGTMDAIVNFDVMEHLTQPVKELGKLCRLLKPGGIMLIETGDSGSSHWRMVGRDYNYCSIVEHVGFFNKQSIKTACERAGMKLTHFQRSIHEIPHAPLGVLLMVPVEVAAYYGLRLLRAGGVRLPERLDAIAAGGTPGGIEWHDHFLAVVRREE